ncbi:hypothetical protein SCP_1301260 [Sparassis crispa]|uniref:Uncharacterized protein n=1 Tax=Sparassis crispa TaxID=139825 RepID=A0A401H1K4_9APHY|nr:hypothetical protein SCP_1301260 [Sparassis crispa]GBE88311.1 hypothetical protein SCP_1301260 [Sparassis crispa]
MMPFNEEPERQREDEVMLARAFNLVVAVVAQGVIDVEKSLANPLGILERMRRS